MSLEGFIGSILTGLVLIFVIETAEFYIHRRKKEDEFISHYRKSHESETRDRK